MDSNCQTIQAIKNKQKILKNFDIFTVFIKTTKHRKLLKSKKQQFIRSQYRDC